MVIDGNLDQVETKKIEEIRDTLLKRIEELTEETKILISAMVAYDVALMERKSKLTYGKIRQSKIIKDVRRWCIKQKNAQNIMKHF